MVVSTLSELFVLVFPLTSGHQPDPLASSPFLLHESIGSFGSAAGNFLVAAAC
jgi:hypothetical protein